MRWKVWCKDKKGRVFCMTVFAVNESEASCIAALYKQTKSVFAVLKSVRQ